VIGTLAKAAEKKGWDTYMMTMDKDMMQLVSENIFMYKPPSKGGSEPEILGKKEVMDKFGISDPSGVIDILALWGDTSDNIPGVPGIGEKTSKELISQYHSIDNLLYHINELKNSIKEKILANREQIGISRHLASIVTDAELDVNLEDLRLKTADEIEIRNICKELEFRTLPERLLSVKKGKSVRASQGSLFEEFHAPSIISTDEESEMEARLMTEIILPSLMRKKQLILLRSFHR
jgi:DNA polymerase-1